MKIVCVITARGGSKRVPRKNVKDFLGKPLIAWSIEVAKKSGVLDRIIVSTEDEEIAKTSREYGAEVPFMRPAELAEDSTPTLPVLQHAVQWLKINESYEPDWAILLEPSSPGRQPFHIREVLRILEKKGSEVDSVTGVSEMPGHFHPLKSLTLQNDGTLARYGDGELIRNLIHRSQDLPKLYFINSAIYAFKTKNFFENPQSLWGNKTLAYIMDPKYACDIDTPEDWIVAEAKMKQLGTDSLL